MLLKGLPSRQQLSSDGQRKMKDTTPTVTTKAFKCDLTLQENF
jgi:hypothetical protein